MVYIPQIASCVFVFIQLIDLSDIFISTDVQFLRSALSQPGGYVQAICVPRGVVRTFKEKALSGSL